MIRKVLAQALLFVCCGTASGFAQPTTPAPAPPPGPAQPERPVPPPAPPYPNIRVGATLFANHTYTFAGVPTIDADGNRYSPNAFNVARSYINVTGSLSRVIAFRFTPDIAQETGTGSALNGSLTFRVKYAFLQTNLDKWLGAGTWARFGMQPTAFVNFSEDLYRYRFQGPIFVDREGYLSSSDAGIALRYNLPGNYGDVHAGIYNGETYRKFEVNDKKALTIRGSVRPLLKTGPLLRGLRFTGYYHGDAYTRKSERIRKVGSVTFEHKYLNAAFDYLSATDRTSARAELVASSGYSIWATPKAPNGWEGLLRFDQLSPDNTRDESRTRTILGVAYWVPLQSGTATAFLVDYEQVASAGFVPARPTERRLALHVLLNF